MAYAQVLESALYAIWDQENGEEWITFNCEVTATLEDGSTVIHKTFHADGRKHRFSRNVAREFADKVEARGVIDLAYWEPYVDNRDSLEERWDGYAREEQIERNGGRL